MASATFSGEKRKKKLSGIIYQETTNTCNTLTTKPPQGIQWDGEMRFWTGKFGHFSTITAENCLHPLPLNLRIISKRPYILHPHELIMFHRYYLFTFHLVLINFSLTMHSSKSSEKDYAWIEVSFKILQEKRNCTIKPHHHWWRHAEHPATGWRLH